MIFFKKGTVIFNPSSSVSVWTDAALDACAFVCVSPGFRQQGGVLVRRGGFWEVVEDSEPMLEELGSVVREQDVQRLHVALL